MRLSPNAAWRAAMAVALVLFMYAAPAFAAAEGDMLAQALDRGLIWALGFVFLGGMGTSLTPCVYPLIPITVNVFGAAEARNRLEAAALSILYVLGMATMYSVLGVISGVTGSAFGSVMANEWIVFFVVGVFVVMSASMLGAFDIALPERWANRASRIGGKGFLGSYLMGLVSGIVAAPCTGPVLAAVLAYIAKAGDPVMGFLLMFTFALGMGFLFFMIGTFAISLPKSGQWMEAVKSFFAVVMLGTALFLMKAHVPLLNLRVEGGISFLIASLALFFQGVVMGGLHKSFKFSAWSEKLAKAVGVLLMVGGLHLMITFAEQGPGVVAGAARAGAAPARILWASDEATAAAAARSQQKPMLIDFTAEWCVACKELEKYTFSDSAVIAAVQRFVPLRIDATHDDDPAVAALLRKYGVVGLPTVAFVDSAGQVLGSPRVIGFMKPDEFAGLLAQIR